MKSFLLSLLPWTRREWSDFFADLAPLSGLLLFSADPRNIMLPLYPELYFVFGYGLVRLTATAIYTAYQQSKEMGLADLNAPENPIGKIFYLLFITFFGAILLTAIICIILIIIGFNFFFYLMIELFLSVANTGGMEANFTFLKLYDSLSAKEQYFIWAMFLFTMYRYLPKLIHFFQYAEYKNQNNSLAWLALGTPAIIKNNRFKLMVKAYQNMTGGDSKKNDLSDSAGAVYFLFLVFYFGAIVLMIKFPIAGPILTLLIKAFAEMYFFRLYKEAPAI